MATMGNVDPKYIERAVAKVTEDDAQRVVAKTEAITAKAKSGGPLQAQIDDLWLLVSADAPASLSHRSDFALACKTRGRA